MASLLSENLRDPRTIVTARQLELIALYASGHQLDEIAAMKYLSYNTVKNTLTLARERVGARSLTHLCVVCRDHGMLYQNGSGFKPVQEERIA